MKNFLTKAISTWRSLKTFIQEGIWTRDMGTLPRLRQALFAFCRIVLIVIRGFKTDRCSLQASALTYISLVSLVPMLAIMFSFSKGIGMQNKLLESIGIERIQTIEGNSPHHVSFRIIGDDQKKGDKAELPEGDFIAQKLPPPMKEALIKILVYVENTNFAALGLIGSLVLLFSVIGSMSKLESSFNDIWGVTVSRSFFRKATEYLVVLILFPVVILVATSLNTLLLSNHIVAYLQELYGPTAFILRFFVRLCGALAILFAFGFFYRFMPNTHVKFLPALIAGFVTGICWFIVQWAYLSLQVGLTRFNSIYGTFAVVPFFLAWLYANWSILLIGAELSYAIQNHRTIHIEKATENASGGICILIAQLIMYDVCRAFHLGKGPWNATSYAQEHSIPSPLLLHVIDVLVLAGLLVKTETKAKHEEKYLPGRDIALLSPADIEEAFRQNQSLDARSYLRDLPEALRKNYINTYTAFCNGLSSLKFGELVQTSEH